MNKDRDTIDNQWEELVNMTATELEDWLKTNRSKSVGVETTDGDSVGRKSGRKIVKILRKSKSDLTEDDWTHKRKVVGFINRHSAQPPGGDATETDWRYSLMNWGHDPLK